MARHQIDIFIQGHDRFSGELRKSLSSLRQMRTDYLGIMKGFAAVGIALRGIEALTDMAVAWRDKGAAEGMRAFAENIPFIGPSIINLSDGIAELVYNVKKLNEEEKELNKPQWDISKLQTLQNKVQNELELARARPDERETIKLEQARRKEIEDVDELIEKMPALTHQYENLKNGLNEIYDLRIEEIDEKRKQDEYLEYLKRWESAQDRILDVTKMLRREIDLFGKNQYEGILYDLLNQEFEPSADEIREITGLINELRARKRPGGAGPTPGWSPVESMHLRGIAAPAMNYEAQTARNTAETNKLLQRVEQLQKQILRKTSGPSIAVD